MKKINKITNDNYKKYSVSIFIKPILDTELKGITMVKKNTIIDKFFGLKRVKLINIDTYYYDIDICIERNGYDTLVLKIKDLDKNKYLIPFMSFVEIKELQFFSMEYLPNLNIEYIMKSIKKELQCDVIESTEMINEIILIVKKLIKDEKYDLKKKDITKMVKLNSNPILLLHKLNNDIYNKNLPKNLQDYIDIFSNNY